MNFLFSVILNRIDNGVITLGEFLEDLELNYKIYSNKGNFKYDIFGNIDKDLLSYLIKKNFVIEEIV